MFIIQTNTDGCVAGDYYAEAIKAKNEARIILSRVREGDPNAKLYLIDKEDLDGK